MGRTARNHTPNLRPVQKVELSDKNIKQRLAAVIILLVIAGCALAYAFNGLMSTESGLIVIEAGTAAETDFGDDFMFQYYIGVSGVNAAAEKKAITLLYTDSIAKAYQSFHSGESFDGITNVYDINKHPNEELVVDEVLYHAFELLEQYGRRELYFAPIYTEYDNLFFCNDDSETINYDAYQNADVAHYFAQIVSYANNPQMIDLQLLGENRVRLFVSDEYLAYAKENFISDYIDFSWIKNAFVIDYLADTMIEHGYTRGSIVSYDGFSRNFDSQNATEYKYDIYDRQGNTIYPAGVLNYTAPKNIVFLRDYPMSNKDKYHYYQFRNGDIRTVYVDDADGLSKCAVSNIISYSAQKGCTEILLSLIPVFISDSFDADAAKDMAENYIYSIWCEENVVYYTENTLSVSNLYEKDTVSYEAKFFE